jgi:predicted ATPase/DNA-binding SARP family transcriptional activator
VRACRRTAPYTDRVPIVLTLLDGVRWQGEPVVGERPQALLAALAGGRSVSAERLVESIWADEVPASPVKALQVLVSRVRAACGPEAVARTGDGYRLGLADTEVDALVLRSEAQAARDALPHDATAAAEHARTALSLGRGVGDGSEERGPLADVRRDAAGSLAVARRVLAQARSRTGGHDEALPSLEQAAAAHPDDEALLVDLLTSLAAVRGPAAALERFERYRSGLRDRLGTDPGPELRRLHQQLLSLDSPVRDGVHYEATALLGRGDDIRRLRAAMVASRVVSIVGPGGLGKTRLAHVLGRSAVQPIVHFVELVGVTAPEDLVGEVGSALGVRDSVSGRRTLTPEQRADVRARIAQHLDQAPSLLILDNCEHVVDAVADLVAFLVATTREVRVLTTTRAPLAIAAERVYPLGELGREDALELFGQRAVAARPDVVLDEAAVADIVSRLDGLPLAIELAAAKVRVMSTADIARRLQDRFALLRGGDRSAPDRHQTLLAVIDWSWNLLGEDERRALRWLSVFHDGFTLEAAERVLGPSALDAVQSLANQSLLTVVETADGVRCRMLETVREFGRVQLDDASEEAEAQDAQRHWALGYADTNTSALMGPDQFAAVDAFRAEENNLADVLRRALAVPEPETVARILAGVGCYWSIVGDHARVWVLADSVAEALRGWTPPPELGDAARLALSITVNNAMIGNSGYAEELRAMLRELGPGDGDPRIAAQVTIMQDFEPADGAGFLESLREHADSDNRYLATFALQWCSHALENSGDPEAALETAHQAIALVEASDGPWQRAILHTQIAQLAMQLGQADEAVEHARAALPVLERLGAHDDALQLRSMLVLSAIGDGDLDRAATEIEILGTEQSDYVFGSRMVIDLAGAELALARGHVDEGLEQYRAGVARVRDLHFPGVVATGLEPWVLFVESAALTAYAYHGADGDGYAAELYRTGLRRLDSVLDPEYPYLDYPVCGVAMFGLGAWGALRGALPIDDAVRSVVLADRFAYNRTIPTMAWSRLVARLEQIAPGRLATISTEYGERRGPDLLKEARAFVAELR